MVGRRGGEELVRADQVAAVVPRAAGRPGDGRLPAGELRGPRFLSPDFRDALGARARNLGFDLCRVASPESIPLAPARLAQWLDSGAQGDMDWMAETSERRAHPRVLWPGVGSIIVLGMNYGPEGDALEGLADRRAGNISVYARHRDYHDVIKGRLKTLAGWIVSEAGGDVKVFVDTAPVMEKPLAQAAGVGWQGKHTNLVSRQFGSWLFLGSVFTTLEIAPDAPEADHCGSCQACLDICPTRAFPAPYRLDARRCVSYLAIEHKGHIAREFRVPMGNRVYGCDDCLAVCPWNKYAQVTREAKLAARADLAAPRLADLGRLDDAGFRAMFAGSPVKRVGHARFLRNVLIAIGNSGDVSLAAIARDRLAHDSPLVRAMAAWALGRLLPRAEFDALARARAPAECDAEARAEWSLPA